MSNGPRDLRFSVGDRVRLTDRDRRPYITAEYGLEPLEVVDVEPIPEDEVYDWHTQMLGVRLPMVHARTSQVTG